MVVAEHRPGSHQVGAIADVLARDGNRRQHLEQLWFGGAEHVGDLETVDQRRFAAGAVEVQAVQHLQSRRIVAVGAVGVRRQVQVGVGHVGLRQIGGELPEPSEDRLPDVGDAPNQGLGGRSRCRGAGDDGEPVRGDGGQPFAQAIVAADDCVERNSDGLVGDCRAIPRERPGGGRDARRMRGSEAAQELDRDLGDLCRVGAVARPGQARHTVVGRCRRGPKVGRERRRVELALLSDRVDRGFVVGVIAQPQPRVPALDAVIPCDVQARLGRFKLIDGGHPAILPARAARLMR